MFLHQSSNFQIQKSKNILESIAIQGLYSIFISNNRTLVLLSLFSIRHYFLDGKNFTLLLSFLEIITVVLFIFYTLYCFTPAL